jgi:hypothetical protein
MPTENPLPSIDTLRELFSYDSKTGNLEQGSDASHPPK